MQVPKLQKSKYPNCELKAPTAQSRKLVQVEWSMLELSYIP